LVALVAHTPTNGDRRKAIERILSIGRFCSRPFRAGIQRAPGRDLPRSPRSTGRTLIHLGQQADKRKCLAIGPQRWVRSWGPHCSNLMVSDRAVANFFVGRYEVEHGQMRHARFRWGVRPLPRVFGFSVSSGGPAGRVRPAVALFFGSPPCRFEGDVRDSILVARSSQLEPQLLCTLPASASTPVASSAFGKNRRTVISVPSDDVEAGSETMAG